jgi:pimeloyl-ACP methyl ester carboxylesterase
MSKTFYSYLAVSLLVICFSNKAVELPVPAGPYPVGTLIYHWTDSSRHESLSPGADHYRELMVQVWYPSEMVKDRVFMAYIPAFNATAGLKSELRGRGLPRSYIKEILLLQTHAVPGADISPCRQKYPVVIFSHGNGTNRSAYTVFMEELASQGYIVFGLDHPYGAGMVVFPDGHIVTQQAAYQDRMSFAERVATWSADQRFALDEIEKLAAHGSIFSGHLDINAVAVAGHSLGGISAAKTCALDKRFKAAINLDGGSGNISEALESKPGRPFMLMRKAGTEFSIATDQQLAGWGMTRGEYNELMQKNDQEEQAVFQDLAADAWEVTIRGAAHNSFSDIRLLEHDNKGIDAVRALAIINDYLLAFLDKYLLNQSPSLFSNTVTKYPEVTARVFRAR